MNNLGELERQVEAQSYGLALSTYRGATPPVGSEARWHYLGALSFQATGDLWNARLAAEKALSYEPSGDLRMLVRFRLGYLSREIGDAGSALEQFEAILEEEHESTQLRQVMLGAVWQNLGLAHYQRRNLSQAIRYYRQACQAFQQEDMRQFACHTLHNLSWTLAETGDLVAANQALAEANQFIMTEEDRHFQNVTYAFLARCDGDIQTALRIAAGLVENSNAPVGCRGYAAWVAGTAALDTNLPEQGRLLADVASANAITAQDTRLMGLAQDLRTKSIRMLERGA